LQGDKPSASVVTEGSKEAGSGVLLERFEDNFKELQKWVEVKSSKYGILSITRERHRGRLGTALKVFSFPFTFRNIRSDLILSIAVLKYVLFIFIYLITIPHRS
jgi:hypothetical protein